MSRSRTIPISFFRMLIIPFIGYNIQIKRGMAVQHTIVTPPFLLYFAMLNGTFKYYSLTKRAVSPPSVRMKYIPECKALTSIVC